MQLEARVIVHDNEIVYFSGCENISTSGILLNDSPEVSVGDELQMVILTGDLEQPLYPKGKVVRTDEKEKATAVIISIA